VPTIDLNADLGEGCGNDAALMPLITSANIAAGGHAGDAVSIMKARSLAALHRVGAGMHPSYPDRENFGRVSLKDMDWADLDLHLRYQSGAFIAVAGAPTHIKAHGALYNDLMVDRDLADLFMRALFRRNGDGYVVGLGDSALNDAADEYGIAFIREAFADRAYLSDGTLAPRAMDGAVLHDPAVIAERAVRMVTTGQVETLDGSVIEVWPDTLCVHGDTQGAVEITAAVRDALSAAGITIKAWS
jgi:UPF0271 protein